MSLVVLNPQDREDETAWLFSFGVYGWTRILWYGNSLEDGLEECAAWLAEHAPGHIMTHDDPELARLYREAGEELGMHWDALNTPWGWEHENDKLSRITELAEADLTYTESGYLTSYEWTVTEDPSDEYLAALGLPDYSVSAQHIDTCTSDYLSDHHNRPGECLIGVPLGEDRPLGELVEYELRGADYDLPAWILDSQIVKACNELDVDLRPCDGDGNRVEFDSEDESNDDGSDMPMAWILLTWDATTEGK
jgi:hypothetical protein